MLVRTATSSIEVTGLTDCCGIRVLSSTVNNGFAKEAIEAGLASQDHGRGMALYATIYSQKEIIKALKETGFKPVAKCRNPNTNRIITLWANIMRPVTRPRKAITA